MLETTPACENKSLRNKMSSSQFWSAVLLPPADGIFVVDVDWTGNGFTRIQSLVCPATPAGIDGMHPYGDMIVALTFIAPADHDAKPRSAPLQIDAIETGLDGKHGCRKEVLVRTVDGKWHACTKGVNVADVGERELHLDLKKSDALEEYLASKAKPSATR